MSRRAPYTHADGSACYTRDCRRGNQAGAPVRGEALFRERRGATRDQMGQRVHDHIMRELEAAAGGWTGRALAIRALIEKHWVLTGEPMVGRTRAVFDMGDGRVMKVAFTDEGALANSMEWRASRETNPYIPVAACEWAEVDGVDVMMMERVEPLTHIDYKTLPDWVGYVDCGQVGYAPDGRLLAYDL